MNDFFRLTSQPAQMIYDAFQDEARKRPDREVHEWVHQERLRVFRTARAYTTENNLICPTYEQIKWCETYALGHVDFGAKWAYRISELIRELNQ